jgi:hypothetical protein
MPCTVAKAKRTLETGTGRPLLRSETSVCTFKLLKFFLPPAMDCVDIITNTKVENKLLLEFFHRIRTILYNFEHEGAIVGPC